jgi:hypothetical protein
MFITMRWDADFNTRMSGEGEKSGASGPTDSIRKMPPRGPVDQVSHSVTMRSNQPAAFCTQRGHEFLSARKTASLYAGVSLSFSRSISIPAPYSRCLNGKSERPSRARTEVRNSVKASSYSCNAATSALSITVLLKPMPRVGGGILATFKTQHEAIDWARKQGHAPLVARVRHLNDKKKPDHWRAG